MKTTLKLLFIALACGTIQAQTGYPPNGDSTFYYRPDGSKDWWYYQRDVAFFRYNGGAAFTAAPPTGITSITHLVDHPDGYNMITFDTSATDFQNTVNYYYINSYPGFEYGFLAMTKDKDAFATANSWVMGGDEIIVVFRDASLTPLELSAFMDRNDLTLKHAPDPSLPTGAPNNWAYIFRITGNDRFIPFEKCQHIWEDEAGYVTTCEPDLQLYKPSGSPLLPPSCQDSPEMTANAPTNTPDALWHIRNNGAGLMLNPINSLPMQGQSGSDANICECWGEGYHGEGITVAVCDLDGFHYSHPDMSGQFLGGFDFINMTSFNSDHYPNSGSPDAHGTEVASVIAAKANSGATTDAVGVAYASQIRPYLHSGFSSEIIMAIQQGVTDNVDIFNMSFGTVNNAITSSNLYSTIQNGLAVGRGGKGIIYVAGTGNNNASARFWPAMDDGVIGVGATLPDDDRAYPGQWFWNAGGSNYFNNATASLRYDVMAPGTQIILASTTSPASSPVAVNRRSNGTSYATPIVSGIAAIILSQYPNVTYQQMIHIIDGNADKVGSSAGYFNPNIPLYNGYDDKYFFGRVNCFNSLNNPTTGIFKSKASLPENISLAYLTKDEAMILFTKGTNDKGSTLKIYDISGRLIESQMIEQNVNTYALNTAKYTAGVYVINVTSLKNGGQATFKYLK